MKIYTNSRLGAKQSFTPEGFLVCESVPIARIGTLYYLPGEVPLAPGKDGLIHVTRDAEEVFREESIASFAGKPVVDEHPTGVITPANWKLYTVGVVQNPRRGAGDDADLLLADLLITDAAAIAAVRAGKRQVSCGYDADYEDFGNGCGRQRNIVGNHVALVRQGRCGPRCSIGDARMQKRAWTDEVRAAFAARDQAALESALDEAPADPVQVHIHNHAASAEPPAQDADAPAGASGSAPADNAATTDAAVTALTDRVSKIEGTLDALTQGVAALTAAVNAQDAKPALDTKTADAKEDEDEDEDEEKPTKDQATADSSGLADAFKQTLAAAEILAPGLALPTFDAAAPAQVTEDALCLFRRRALHAAYADGVGKAAIDSVLGGARLKGLTCDGVRGTFFGAAALVRSRNNQDLSAVLTAPARANGAANSLKEINRRNAEFWRQRGGSVG